MLLFSDKVRGERNEKNIKTTGCYQYSPTLIMLSLNDRRIHDDMTVITLCGISQVQYYRSISRKKTDDKSMCNTWAYLSTWWRPASSSLIKINQLFIKHQTLVHTSSSLRVPAAGGSPQKNSHFSSSQLPIIVMFDQGNLRHGHHISHYYNNKMS